MTALSEKVQELRSASKMLEIDLKGKDNLTDQGGYMYKTHYIYGLIYSAKQQAVRGLSAGGQYNTNLDGE